MTDITLDFCDRVVHRVWPHLDQYARINTCALVMDVLEGHTRFVVSDELAEKIRAAAKEIEGEKP